MKTKIKHLIFITLLFSPSCFAVNSEANLYTGTFHFTSTGSWSGVWGTDISIPVTSSFAGSSSMDSTTFWVGNGCIIDEKTKWGIYLVHPDLTSQNNTTYKLKSENGIKIPGSGYSYAKIYDVMGWDSCKMGASTTKKVTSSGTVNLNITPLKNIAPGIYNLSIPVKVVAIKNEVPPSAGWGALVAGLPDSTHITANLQVTNRCSSSPKELLFDYGRVGKSELLANPFRSLNFQIECVSPAKIQLSYIPALPTGTGKTATSMGKNWEGRLSFNDKETDQITFSRSAYEVIKVTSAISESTPGAGELGEIEGSGVIKISYQ